MGSLGAGGEVYDNWVSTRELVEVTGMTYREMDYWTRVGILKPLNGGTPGSGFPRRWAKQEVTVACAVLDVKRVFGTHTRFGLDNALRIAKGARAAVRGRGRWLVVTGEYAFQSGNMEAVLSPVHRTLVELRWLV